MTEQEAFAKHERERMDSFVRFIKWFLPLLISVLIMLFIGVSDSIVEWVFAQPLVFGTLAHGDLRHKLNKYLSRLCSRASLLGMKNVQKMAQQVSQMALEGKAGLVGKSEDLITVAWLKNDGLLPKDEAQEILDCAKKLNGAV